MDVVRGQAADELALLAVGPVLADVARGERDERGGDA